MAECWGRPGEKQASSSSRTTMSRSGPVAGAQGVGGRRGAGVKSSSDSTRYSSSLALSSQTGRGSPHSALSSAQATALRSVLSGSLEGR